MKEELGRQWLEPELFPIWCFDVTYRHRTAARAFRNWPLFGGAPTPDGLVMNADTADNAMNAGNVERTNVLGYAWESQRLPSGDRFRLRPLNN